MDLKAIGAICQLCGATQMDVIGKPVTCDECVSKMSQDMREVEKGDYERDIMTMISSPYLTAACVMVSEQFIHRAKKLRPQTKEDFYEEATQLMRYHAPIAYAYFFDHSQGKDVIPMGTLSIIQDMIWSNPLSTDFLGGKHSGIILPGQS